MSDWITWEGGECPVEPDTLVQVQFRGETRARAGRSKSDTALDQHGFDWSHNNNGGDIIAYRIIQS